MALRDKIAGFGYLPFLKKLLREGKYQWVTPPEKGSEVFVTTLYLDGDMLCHLIGDGTEKTYNVPPGLLENHMNKIDKDLNSVFIFSNHLSLLAGTLFALLTFLINPAGWIENLTIIGGIGIVAFLGRKITRKVVFKIIGIIAGLIFNSIKS